MNRYGRLRRCWAGLYGGALHRIGVRVLIGGALELNEPWLRHFPWAAILQRPISLGAIADRVAQTR